MRALLAALVCALALPAAALAGWVPINPRQTTSECGSPSRVKGYGSAGRGAAIGPLVLPFDDGGRGTAAKTYYPGYPTRIVIRLRGPRPVEMTLRGYHCDTGGALRFWYRNAPLSFSPGFPTTVDQLQSRGDLGVRFRATRNFSGAYTGYMLFWATGDWRLVLSGGGRTIGSVVVHVSEPLSR